MSNEIEIRFLGAIDTVTGSCTHLRYIGENGEKKNYLIDAGVFQGECSDSQPISEILEIAPILDGIFITHSHIDHIGLIPQLIQHNFDGKIYCSMATADLLLIMLKDFMQITKMNKSTTKNIINTVQSQFYKIDNNDIFQFGCSYLSLANDFTVGFLRTSHILGSVSYYFQWCPDPSIEKRRTLTFSGDLGPVDKDHTSFMAKEFNYPYYQTPDNVYVLESTYGSNTRAEDITHENRLAKLADILKKSINQGRHIIIPVFSQQRAQEVLLDLFFLKEIQKIRGNYYTPAFFLKTKKPVLDSLEAIVEKNNMKEGILISLLSSILEKYGFESKICSEFQWRDLDEKVLHEFVQEINTLRNTTNERTFKLFCMPGMIDEINSVFQEHLFDFHESEKHGFKYKYLTDTFLKEFLIFDNDKSDEIDSVKDILKSCFTDSYKVITDKDHKNLFDHTGTKVVLASSGMCDHGGVLNLLGKYHHRKDLSLILTGYQAPKTNGFLIKNKKSYGLKQHKLKMNDLGIYLSDLKNEIVDLSPYYSGHADSNQLVNYITGNGAKVKNKYPSRVFLNHGSEDSRAGLKEKIENISDKFKVELPEINKFYKL